jgi:glutamine synthetase
MSEFSKKAPAAGEPRNQAQTLHRQIGKPAGEWVVDDLVGFVRDQGIRVLSLMHVGGDGWLKALDFVPRDSSHLADVLTGGERADGSSLFGDLGIPVGASDIVMRPRLATAFIDPFARSRRWRCCAAISRRAAAGDRRHACGGVRR